MREYMWVFEALLVVVLIVLVCIAALGLICVWVPT